jgi:hypothetical protein
VQPALRGDPLVTGVEVQVERVPEDDLVAERGDLGREQPLDRRLRRQRDERRGADLAVRGAQDPGPRARAGIGGEDLETGDGYERLPRKTITK